MDSVIEYFVINLFIIRVSHIYLKKIFMYER